MEPEPRLITVQGFIRKTGAVRAYQRKATVRRRVAQETSQVNILLPVEMHDRFCKEALRRDTSVACVIREYLSRALTSA